MTGRDEVLDLILTQLGSLDQRLQHIEKRLTHAEDTLQKIDNLHQQLRGAWWFAALCATGLIAGAWSLLHKIFPAPTP